MVLGFRGKCPGSKTTLKSGEATTDGLLRAALLGVWLASALLPAAVTALPVTLPELAVALRAGAWGRPDRLGATRPSPLELPQTRPFLAGGADRMDRGVLTTSIWAMLSGVKLSQGVEWGLHCVTLLAQLSDEAVVRREQLANHYGLREPYLAKHLQALTRAGVLRATSGPKGGYRLGRAARAITVLDVVDAIEGGAAPFVCQEIRQRGTGALRPDECTKLCLIHSTMNTAHEAWRTALRAVSIADLAGRLPEWVREQNRRRLTGPIP